MSSTSLKRSTLPRFDRRTSAALTVSVLILILVAGYFALSFGSVVGTQIKVVKVTRSLGSGIAPVSFELDILVQSASGFLATYVDDPVFGLRVDDMLFGTVAGGQSVVRPGNSAGYRLLFQNGDPGVESAIGGKASNNLVLSMSSVVDAGWYREDLTRTAGSTWTGNA